MYHFHCIIIICSLYTVITSRFYLLYDYTVVDNDDYIFPKQVSRLFHEIEPTQQ